METIKNYLDSLFLGLPQTPKVAQAKADLLSAMEDHYHGLIDEGKSEHEAVGAVISEFGSLDELKEALELEDEASETTEDPASDATAFQPNQITEGEALRYLEARKKSSLWLSLGIALVILAITPILFMDAAGSAELGFLGFIVFVVLGVGLIIPAGMQFNRLNKQLHDRFVPQELKQLAFNLQEEYHRSRMFSLVAGICLCIFSIFPLILMEVVTNGDATMVTVGVAGLFICVAAGVFLIVYGSLVHTSFTKFTQGAYFVAGEDELGPNAQAEKYGDAAPQIQALSKIYWPGVVLLYFAWSFISGTWAFSWVIFVVAGLLYNVIEGILKAKGKSNY